MAIRQTPEREVKRVISDYLALRGHFIWWACSVGIPGRKTNGRYQRNGVSDILGITKDGRMIAIEVKRPKGGVVSAEQKEFIDLVNKFGGIGLVAKSIEDVQCAGL
jgi:hypothetical protein